MCYAQLLNHVQLFATPLDHSQPGSSVHGIFPARILKLGCHFFLQSNFPTQEWKLCLLHLLHWLADSLALSHLGK